MSSFERRFSELENGSAVLSTRVEAFDFDHSLFFNPLLYVSKAVDITTGNPDREWIQVEFLSFVRAEFSGYSSGYKASVPNLIESGRCELDEVAIRYRNIQEQKLVFGDKIGLLLSDTNVFSSKERLYKIFTDGEFGRSENLRNISYEEFAGRLNNIDVGLRLVVPGLPFRDQNRFRTRDLPATITMAEVMFVVRMHCIALAAYQVLPPGADVLILSDGKFYHDIFDVDREDTEKYLEEIRRLRNKINISGTVSIICLEELINKYDSDTGRFEATCAHIYNVLEQLSADKDKNFDQAAASMENGFRRNFSTLSLKSSDSDVERWLNGEMVEGGSLPDGERVKHLTLTYASRNLALKWHDVVQKMLPTTVRATMHPKPSQIGLPKLGATFPWNGVAVLPSDAVDIDSLEIYPLDQAASRYRKLKPMRAETDEIMYYIGVR